ncbi:hypothetical protein ACP4OV_012934 [Aristida adscensionis]
MDPMLSAQNYKKPVTHTTRIILSVLIAVMPLRLAAIVVPPLCVSCLLLYLAGVPWGIIGRVAAVLFSLLVVTGLCDRLRRRAPPEPDADDEPSMPAPRREEAAALGLGASAIAGLPVYKYKKKHGGGSDECLVCLGEIRPKEAVKQLPVCTHLFHEECIDVWLRSHRTCPVCRSTVDSAVGPAHPELGV